MDSGYYREQARYALRGNWGKSILVCLLAALLGADTFMVGVENRMNSDTLERFRHMMDTEVFRFFLLIMIGISSIITVYTILVFIIGGAIEMGQITFFTGLVERRRVAVSDLFSQFHLFGKALGLRIVTTFFVSLWSMLFVIPGIVAAFRYAMAPYIMAENPDVGIMEAIDLSKEMMRGNKGRLFWLMLSFIGWIWLGVITGGIGLLWVMPYEEAAIAAFYLDISRAERNGTYGYAQY